MGRYQDIIEGYGMPYLEDLDMEDLALIESVVGTIEEHGENGEKRKSMKWQIEEMLDEI
jgi:hypothetical protein